MKAIRNLARRMGFVSSLCIFLSIGIFAGCDTIGVQPESPAVDLNMQDAQAGMQGPEELPNNESAASYILEFDPNMGPDEVEATAKRIVRRYGLRKRHVYKYTKKGVAGTMNPRALEALLNNPTDRDGITAAFPDLPFEVTKNPHNSDGSVGQMLPWGIDHVDADLSSTVAGDGQGTVPVDVYVIDSGVSHADVNVVESIDFRDSPVQDPADNFGHGTHIAGTIAAMDDDAGVVGTAPGAQVHSLKVLSDNGAGQFSDVLAALDYVVQQKVENPTTPMVINLSLGADMGSTEATVIDEGVQHAIDVGITVVVAAGNNGVDVATVTPAHVSAAITVGAYDPTEQFATFSNFGSGIDILAPGVSISSLFPDGSRVAMDGTSMAAAHVSGAAALYLSQHPDASPAAVQQALIDASLPAIGAPAGTTTRRLSMLGF